MTGGGTIRREVLLPALPHRVWDALTKPRELSAWFGADAEVDLRPGGSAAFRWADGSVRRAAVEVVEVDRLLVLRWLPFEEDPGGRRTPRIATMVTFLLHAEEHGTRLIVTESSPARDEGRDEADARPMHDDVGVWSRSATDPLTRVAP